MNTLVALVGVLGGLFGVGGGGYMLLTLRQSRRKIEAEAEKISAGADRAVADTVKILIGGAADLVEPLKRQLREVNTELELNNRQIRDANVEMSRLRREFGELDSFVHRVLSYIHTPDMEMGRLRILVPLRRSYGGLAAGGNGNGEEPM